jgi:hypothetical protein
MAASMRHRRHQPEPVAARVELLQLVEEGGRLAVAVRVHERHAIRLAGVVDVPEHAAEDGDPDAARDEHVRRGRVLRQDEIALRLLDLDLRPDRQLDERPLERRVAEAGAEAEHAALRRRRDHGDVSPRSLLVVVRRIEQLDPEVLAGAEVDLRALQVEEDEQRPLRHLPLLLDQRAHVGRSL